MTFADFALPYLRFEAGGGWMYPVTAFAILSWLAAAIALLATLLRSAAAIPLSCAGGACSVFAIGSSCLGTLISFQQAFIAIAHVNPPDAPILVAAATAESLTLAVTGLGVALLPLIGCWVLYGLAVARVARGPGLVARTHAFGEG